MPHVPARLGAISLSPTVLNTVPQSINIWMDGWMTGVGAGSGWKKKGVGKKEEHSFTLSLDKILIVYHVLSTFRGSWSCYGDQI